MTKLVFLGSGNMAEALLRGLLTAGVPASSIVMTDRLEDRLKTLSSSYDVSGSLSNREAAASASTVILAVKPPVVGSVLEEIAPVLSADTRILSVVAGLTTARIERLLGGEPRVVRAMPNTPALVGCGATAYCGGRWARREDLEAAQQCFGSVGVALEVREQDLDAVTALSGSGPAYVCGWIEAMLAAAARMGLAPETARTLALQMVAGTARLLLATGDSPADVRSRVASKGGTTEAALRILEDRDVSRAIQDAMHAAEARSRQLGAEAESGTAPTPKTAWFSTKNPTEYRP